MSRIKKESLAPWQCQLAWGRTVGLALALCVSSCLSARLAHNHEFEEPRADGRLRPGSTGLEQCLAELGAPLLVREHLDGALLAWGWSDERAFGLNLSLPLDNFYSANLSYARSIDGLRGLVLFFDDAWRLKQMRRGYLAEILPDERTRPALVD